MNINPKIKEFWEKIGEVDCTPSAPIKYYVVVTKRDYQTIACIWTGGPQDGPPQSDKYFYNDVEYTEEEMLRIINQKAFI